MSNDEHRSSLVPLPSVVAIEADQLAAAAAALQRADYEGARLLFERVDRDALWGYYDSAGRVWQERHRKAAHADHVKVPHRAIPKSVNLDVAVRDGWRCRYCGVRLISYDFSREVNRRFPDLWVISPAVERNMHPAAYLLRYTPDHVVPHWTGGSNEADNLVACCGTCQYQKGQCTIEELDLSNPFDRAPVIDTWDGLSGRFGPIRF
jgi:hypothetical protein